MSHHYHRHGFGLRLSPGSLQAHRHGHRRSLNRRCSSHHSPMRAFLDGYGPSPAAPRSQASRPQPAPAGLLIISCLIRQFRRPGWPSRLGVACHMLCVCGAYCTMGQEPPDMLRRRADNFSDQLLEPTTRDIDRFVISGLEGLLNLANWLVVIAAIRYAALRTHHNQLILLSGGLCFCWVSCVVLNFMSFVDDVLLNLLGRKSRVALLVTAFLSGAGGSFLYRWVTRVVEALATATQ